MKDAYLKYRYNEFIEFYAREGEFITLLGNSNNLILNTLLYVVKKGNIFIGDAELNDKNLDLIRRRMSIVSYKHLNVFSAETVEDEIAFGLESLSIKKNDIRELISKNSEIFKIKDLLIRDPNSLGSSDKTKMKILSALIVKPKILVIDNILCELDASDKTKIIEILEEYVKFGGILINITNDIEESLYSKRTIIVNNKKLLIDGKSNEVIKNEKLLKECNIGMPFLAELNKYLIDYGVIDKYYLTNKSLVGAIWK